MAVPRKSVVVKGVTKNFTRNFWTEQEDSDLLRLAESVTNSKGTPCWKLIYKSTEGRHLLGRHIFGEWTSSNSKHLYKRVRTLSAKGNARAGAIMATVKTWGRLAPNAKRARVAKRAPASKRLTSLVAAAAGTAAEEDTDRLLLDRLRILKRGSDDIVRG